MIREIIIPTQNTYLLHLPDNLIGKKVEVIAFSNDDISAETKAPIKNKRTVEQAIAFYSSHAIYLNKIDKWTREDLMSKIFIDSNICIYAFDKADEHKREIAFDLLRQQPYISSQVIIETFNACSRN